VYVLRRILNPMGTMDGIERHAMKNERRIIKERIKAGEQMRKNHEKILEHLSPLLVEWRFPAK
jgi:hypothetical protein